METPTKVHFFPVALLLMHQSRIMFFNSPCVLVAKLYRLSLVYACTAGESQCMDK